MCTFPPNLKNTYPKKMFFRRWGFNPFNVCANTQLMPSISVPQSTKKVALVWEVLKTGIPCYLPLHWKALEMPHTAPDFEHDHILTDLPGHISCKTLPLGWPTDLISGLAQHYPSGSWSVSAKHNGQSFGRFEIELFFLMMPC